MSMPTNPDQRQYMAEQRPWADSILRTAAAEIANNLAFRSLIAELASNLATRSVTDAALVILCPGASRAVDEYYGGKGPELRRLLSEPDLSALDAWLLTEVRLWGARWVALDPTRRGSAPTTRAALEQLTGEIKARALPGSIAAIAAKIQAGVAHSAGCEGPGS